jgi:hypothetical protein
MFSDGLPDSAGVPYSPTNDRWWKLRESAGRIYLDTSPNGVQWTPKLDIGVPITLDNNKVMFGTYEDGTSLTAGGTAKFDNCCLH